MDKLLKFIDGLPLEEKGKSYLNLKILVDFYDTWQFDDEANNFTLDEYLANPNNPKFIDVQSTYGIYNTTQIKRYVASFVATLKKARSLALVNHLKKLDELHPAQKAVNLSKTLAKISRAEIFSKYGYERIKDPQWNAELKEILGNEISFAKEQAELLTKAPIQNKLPGNPDDEILIVEELENRLAIEAVDYRHKCDELWEQYKFDPNYFNTFISGPLHDEFVKSVYDRIRPLNNMEINRYLSLSLQQFKTHTPAKRHKAFLQNYFQTYWFPNVMEYKAESYMDLYATHVWKHYTNHFNLFRDSFQNIYDQFKTGLMGINATPSGIYTIDYNSFNQFLKDLEYNYPYEVAPMSMVYQWDEDLANLKKEILENLIHIGADAKKPYLAKLQMQLDELAKNGKVDKTELNRTFVNFNTTEEELRKNRSYNNPLHNALYSLPPTFDESIKMKLNRETEEALFTYYNYHYGRIIGEAIQFISGQTSVIPTQSFSAPIQNNSIESKPVVKQQKTIKSFIYLNFSKSADKITDLHRYLDDKKLIDRKKTSLSDFKKIFSNTEITNKVTWTGTVEELAHFIKTLNNSGKIEDTKQTHWKITKLCFELIDGRDLNTLNLRGQKLPTLTRIKEIEKAINNL
ncbi:MAG: hypothetical protein PHP53_19185 [Prolixibacteraceae bacterium]|nr:hypothetical protein [Prolixibacteraceae bacterium]